MRSANPEPDTSTKSNSGIADQAERSCRPQLRCFPRGSAGVSRPKLGPTGRGAEDTAAMVANSILADARTGLRRPSCACCCTGIAKDPGKGELKKQCRARTRQNAQSSIL